MTEYNLFYTCPIDRWKEMPFIHISDLSEVIIDYIKQNPKSSFTFGDVWDEAVKKIFWAFNTADKFIDFPLRQNDLWFWFSPWQDREEPCSHFDLVLLFKVDNNGTVYAVRESTCPFAEKLELPTEYGDDWELVSQKDQQ